MHNNHFNINFGQSPEDFVHTCEAMRVGDWIVYTCPQCPDYERRINWRTQEMKSKIDQDNQISHTGSYFAEEYTDSMPNPN